MPSIDQAAGLENSANNPAASGFLAMLQTCDICAVNQQERLALVPCGHARFCRLCADYAATIAKQCPFCRANVIMVIPFYN